ncbi:hypothetical protein [Streptomyces violascens]|uniref:hypothetical protein n=1 Tax=Streptomyces violascens TaxID=67381 RepID=UPI0036B0E6C9
MRRLVVATVLAAVAAVGFASAAVALDGDLKIPSYPMGHRPRPGDVARGGGSPYSVTLREDRKPPCWYQHDDGTFSAYDYKQSTGQCPWPGHVELA